MGDPNLGEGHKSPPEPPLQPIEERDSSLGSNPSTDTLSRLQEAQDHQGQSQSQSQPGASHQQTSETRPPNPRRPNLHLGRLSSHQEQPQTPLSVRAAVTRQPTESGSVYYGSHSQQDPSLENRTASQQQVTQWPSHSLAGPNVMDPAQQGNVYVDPEYRQLNPRYGSNNDKPVWGLAKPLPRVVRPGMRRDDSSTQKAYQAEPPGQTQAAPELSSTPGLSSPQSRPTQSHRLPSYSSTAQQGIAKQHAVYAPQPDGVLRPMESEPSERTPSQKAPIEQQGGEQPPAEEFLNTWAKIRHILKEPLAEWLATTVAVLIGLTGTLAVSTGGTQAGSRMSENWSWGLGFMIGIYLAGGISGAHLNPGISIALWIFRGFPGRRCCYYVIAQILGAITAAGLAYCLYRDAIFHLAPHASAGAAGLGFYTEPLSYVSSATAFFTEFVADAILLCVIFAMGDDSNAPPGAGMHSFVIGLVIYVLCICLGFNTGGCLNPVRDFGPRLVALMAGYGSRTFTDHEGWWFWGCWVATIGGSLAGACLYDLFIFIGGESPINYAPRRRQRAKLKKESKWRKRLGVGKQRVPSLEEGIKNLED